MYSLTLNFCASQSITFESIKDIVCNTKNEKLEVDQLKFITKKDDWVVKTEIIKKSTGLFMINVYFLMICQLYHMVTTNAYKY